TSVLAVLAVPIFDGGVTYSQIRHARQGQALLRHQLDDVLRGISLSVILAWEKLQAARAEISELEYATTAAQSAFDGIFRQQQMGTKTVNDVLISRMQVFQTRSSLINTNHDMALSEWVLAQQCGILSMKNLNIENDDYDVKKYYEDVEGKWFGLGEDDQADDRRNE
ncbi:MAG: hypothetical protein F8N39_14110, partial [Clostridiaceae bacterium]|nr:hypothetical protein [Clostridiaceae bacterium]